MLSSVVWILLVLGAYGHLDLLPGHYASADDCESAWTDANHTPAGTGGERWHLCVRTPRSTSSSRCDGSVCW